MNHYCLLWAKTSSWWGLLTLCPTSCGRLRSMWSLPCAVFQIWTQRKVMRVKRIHVSNWSRPFKERFCAKICSQKSKKVKVKKLKTISMKMGNKNIKAKRKDQPGSLELCGMLQGAAHRLDHDAKAGNIGRRSFLCVEQQSTINKRQSTSMISDRLTICTFNKNDPSCMYFIYQQST